MTEPYRYQSRLGLLGLATGALRALSLGGKLLLLLYMGRVFASDALGTWGLFTSTNGLLVSMLGLEYHQHSLRALVQAPPDDRSSRGAIVMSQLRLFGLVYAIAPLVALPLFWASGMPAWCGGYLALTVVAMHVALECQRLLTALARPIAAYTLNLLANGIWIVPVLVTGWLAPEWFTLRLVLAAWAASSSGAAALGVGLLAGSGVFAGASLRRSAIDWSGVRTGLLFFASALCFSAIDTLDRYALEWLRTTEEVGIYTFHASIARTHRDLLFVIAVAPLLPALLAARDRGTAAEPVASDRPHARRLLLVNAGLGAILLVAIHLALWIAQRPALAQHLASFFWLTAGNVVLGLSTFAHYAIYRAHRERTLLHAHIAGLATALIASAAFIPAFGISGAAAANCSALATIALYKQLVYRRLTRPDSRPRVSKPA